MEKKLFLLLLAVWTLVGCDKDAALKKTVEDSVDQVRGTYKIEAMKWLGSPKFIDIDNDGLENTDLYSEFRRIAEKDFGPEHIGLANIYAESTVKEGSGWPRMRELDGVIRLPLQHIVMKGGRYDVGTVNYSTFYQIDGHIEDDGSITFGKFVSSPDSSSMIEDEKALSNGTLSLTARGELQLEIDYMFYDYTTAQIVTGPVRIVFRRTTMKF